MLKYHVKSLLALLALTLATNSFGEITYKRKPQLPDLHIIDGVNRLYVDIEIPLHQMSNMSKKLSVARAIHFVKEDIKEAWRNGLLPTSIIDLIDPAFQLQELNYQKILDNIERSTGNKFRKLVEEVNKNSTASEKLSADKLSSDIEEIDWLLPSGILIDVSIGTEINFGNLKSGGGSFSEIIVPQCVHRLRKIPKLKDEKNELLSKLIEEANGSILDRFHNVVLTSFYGNLCTKDLGQLFDIIKEKEGEDSENYTYVIEEAFVRSKRNLLFWGDSNWGKKLDHQSLSQSTSATPNSTDSTSLAQKNVMPFKLKILVGPVFGNLRQPETFRGAAFSISKQAPVRLPQKASDKLKFWIQKYLSKNTDKSESEKANLVNFFTRFGWGGKIGVLLTVDSIFPFILTGPAFGVEKKESAKLSVGLIFNLWELLIKGFNEARQEFRLDGNSSAQFNSDEIPLNEFAERQANEMAQVRSLTTGAEARKDLTPKPTLPLTEEPVNGNLNSEIPPQIEVLPEVDGE